MTIDCGDEKALFLRALDFESEAQRSAFLAEACAGRPELLAAVQALLQAHACDSNPVDRPVAAGMGQLLAGLHETARDPWPEGPFGGPSSRIVGSHIGPYRIMERIGEGGFGLVFVADQLEPVRRRVALKIIKPGMESREVLARFEAERQAIAMMDHPHIARIFDAGVTEAGQPYFVMELVRGVPLTRFCDQQKLDTNERLRLFLGICNAVQHAHQKGIIHRDLKPSNILVTLQDGQPLAKVIDFGVAKAISQSLSSRTIYTRFASMIGTPAYMSPEQAEISAIDVDTRSDIYSLGVLLYELLTGSTPFAEKTLQSVGFDEMRRMIREEEPPRPSTRLHALTNEQASTIAANRRLDAVTLASSLKRDLDWIVMKALDKDRDRRYPTATALAQDITRYLLQQPIEARPPSAWYRLAKFARRNKVALSTAAAIATALVAGTVISVWQARVAIRERDEKEVALRTAQAAEAAAEAARGELEDFNQRLQASHVHIASARVHADAERWPDAYQECLRAIEMQPRYFLGWLERARLNARLGRWNESASDFAHALDLGLPVDKTELLGVPPLFIYTGSTEAYAQLRERLRTLEDDPGAFAIRGLLVGDPSESEAAELVARIEPMLSANEQPQDNAAASPQPTAVPTATSSPPAQALRPVRDSERLRWAKMYHGVHLYLAGWAHLRAGNLEQAVERLRESNEEQHPWFGRGIGYPLLAIAYHRQGRSAEALECFEQSQLLLDRWLGECVEQSRGAPGLPWVDWIEFLNHHREASIVVKGHTPAIDPQIRQLAAFADATID